MLKHTRTRKERDLELTVRCLPKITSSPEIDQNHKEVQQIIRWLAQMSDRQTGGKEHKEKLRRLDILHKRNKILKGIPEKGWL